MFLLVFFFPSTHLNTLQTDGIFLTVLASHRHGPCIAQVVGQAVELWLQEEQEHVKVQDFHPGRMV